MSTLNVVEKEFNALAAEYENNRMSEWYKAHADEILKHCCLIEKGDILDVGCGTGYFLRSFLQNKPHIRAVGIDISSTMIEEAKNKAKSAGLSHLEFIHLDWEKLNKDLLKDYNFKIIICANTFHYFINPQSASDKLYKQLAQNGKLYILDRNKASSLLTSIWGFIHKMVFKDQVVFYTTSELIHFCAKAGLKKIKTLNNIKNVFLEKQTIH